MTMACLGLLAVHPSELEGLGKLALACVLGGILGLEREMTHHPAGLRTHILVALGSAGFTLTGLFLLAPMPGDMATNLSRVMQGVITGMGFIGAGAIMKEGASIHGLTTAASLWVASSVGLMVACGAFVLAAGTTVLGLVALLLSRSPLSPRAEREHDAASGSTP